MANFAKLDDNNIVIDIVKVNNDVLDLNNEEESGIEFLASINDGYRNWKQTSYNNRIRTNYAVIGSRYDETRDAFIGLQPYPSWILDEETLTYNPPTENPGNNYYWDEDVVDWVKIEFPQPYPTWVKDENDNWVPPIPFPNDGKSYNWNEEHSRWERINLDSYPTDGKQYIWNNDQKSWVEFKAPTVEDIINV